MLCYGANKITGKLSSHHEIIIYNAVIRPQSKLETDQIWHWGIKYTLIYMQNMQFWINNLEFELYLSRTDTATPLTGRLFNRECAWSIVMPAQAQPLISSIWSPNRNPPKAAGLLAAT